jgi:hypothetical protein
MKKVINLSTNQEHNYGDNVSDLVAVCQSYCTTNNLSSWFFALLHNKINFTQSLPIANGKQTLACGEWCIIKS